MDAFMLRQHTFDGLQVHQLWWVKFTKAQRVVISEKEHISEQVIWEAIVRAKAHREGSSCQHIETTYSLKLP